MTQRQEKRIILGREWSSVSETAARSNKRKVEKYGLDLTILWNGEERSLMRRGIKGKNMDTRYVAIVLKDEL